MMNPDAPGRQVACDGSRPGKAVRTASGWQAGADIVAIDACDRSPNTAAIRPRPEDLAGDGEPG
jgi:hypothetical protein